MPNYLDLLFRLFCGMSLLVAVVPASAGDPAEPRVRRFEADVLPILRKHCLKCHGGKSRKGGLSLQTIGGIVRGGESGEPVVVAGDADKSRLIELVKEGEMPPGDARLGDAEVKVLEHWINTSAQRELATVDEICVIRSMWTEHINHDPALWMIHTGRTIPGKPSIGSWVVYGLGSESQDLPAYVVLDDPKGLPVDGIRNWSSGWLPPQFQGTRFRATGTPVWNLNPAREIAAPLQQARRELLAKIDQAHRTARPGEPELGARIASYELAARIQVSATAALDLAQETKATQAAYGIGNATTDSYGRRCLLARRLVERGVRYVQLFINSQIWDNHAGLEGGIRGACARTDQPAAALLADLKQRGMLDETLAIWGGEFGRLPISQSKNGRDHGRQGFTIWMAGGGVKAGHIHGATDEFGYAAVENRVSVPDLHATILHLLGIDHERSTFSRNGLNERLTGVYEPRIIEEIVA